MTLHEAIAQVLLDGGNKPLTAREIADAIAPRRLYVRPSDNQTPQGGQVSASIGTQQYHHLFLKHTEVRPITYYLSDAGLIRFGKMTGMRNRPRIKIDPSVLSADYARLGEAVKEATEAGADLIHIDVMDGQFVPPITVGAQMVKALRPCTGIPLDVHLMVESPECQIEDFAEAGADIITVHVETCPHLHRTIQQIKDLGKRAGVSLNPGTPVSALNEILPSVDVVLVMTVNPGFGGQAFIREMPDKIARVRQELDSRNPEAELEVDGGISATTAPLVVKAGATILVAGAAVFATGDPVRESLQRIRTSW